MINLKRNSRILENPPQESNIISNVYSDKDDKDDKDGNVEDLKDLHSDFGKSLTPTLSTLSLSPYKRILINLREREK
ncbi:hypothetical protein ES703_114520 [subsurface metagenome]